MTFEITTTLLSTSANSVAAREGFSATPYWDVLRESIGYGTPAEGRDHISEEVGYQEMEKHIYTLLEKMQVVTTRDRDTTSDEQIAAVASYLYNVGEGAIGKGAFNAFNEGRDEDFIREVGRWVLAGQDGQKSVHAGLINRRFGEALQYASGIPGRTFTEREVANLLLEGIQQAEGRANVKASEAWTAEGILASYNPASIDYVRDEASFAERSYLDRTQRAVGGAYEGTKNSLGRFSSTVTKDPGKAFGDLFGDMKDNWLVIALGAIGAFALFKIVSSIFSFFGGSVEEAASDVTEKVTAPLNKVADAAQTRVEEIGRDVIDTGLEAVGVDADAIMPPPQTGASTSQTVVRQ